MRINGSKIFLNSFTSFAMLCLFACSNDRPILPKKKASNSAPGFIKLSSRYSDDLPAITNLPFGPKVKLSKLHLQSMYFSGLIYPDVGRLINDGGFTKITLKNIKRYPMPKITSIHYVKITAEDSVNCDNGKPFDEMLKLHYYRYRLPDYGPFKVFYSCNYDYFGKDQDEDTRKYCLVFLKMFYGYLTIYNPVKQSATVLAIYFSSYDDGANHDRHFFIDKNYNIHLVDSYQASDDGDDNPPVVVGSKYQLRILPDGQVKVTSKIN